MIKKLISEIDKNDVISFDIFDTIILRPYVKPSDVFMHIERLLNIKNFAKNRIDAENKARSNSIEGEITYEDIYSNINKPYKEAFQFEIDFEKQICQRNEEMHVAYLHAIEKKKRIIFVSDMYLPQSVLEEILIKTGFNAYDHLFVSSTYKKRKATGELFDVVIEKLSIKPENILHIGDNKNNDVDMAQSRGLKVFYYPKVMDRFLHEHSNMKVLLHEKKDKRFKKDPLSLSIILGLNSIIWVENQKDNYWKRLGSLYAGPFLYFFTKWIYDSAQTTGIKNIAFAARDGFNLIKIFHLFDGNKEFNSQYVYLPRYVSESANIKTSDDLEFFFKELGKTYDGLLNFIQDFSIENSAIRLKWEQFNDSFKEYTYNDLKSFIISNQKLFFGASHKKRDIVYQYFKSINLLGDKLMIIDSSCTHARPQKLLHNIIEERTLDTQLNGYYYKINKPIDFLSQTEIRPEIDKKYRTDKWDFIEFFMSSPESPIIAIKKEGNDYYPVYQSVENNQHERVRIKASTLLTEGIMQFAEKAFGIFGHHDIIENLDTSVYYINNLINNPSTLDISHIKHLHHSVNNDSDYSPLLQMEGVAGNQLRKIYGQRVEVKRLTPEFEHSFLGNFDSKTTNERGTDHLALNIAFMNHLPSSDDKALINIIDNNGSIKKIAGTNAWDFQHGAFVQYRPNHDQQITYSCYDKKEKKYNSILYNLNCKTKNTLPLPVLSISPDGKKALCVNISGPNEYQAGRRNNTIALVNYDQLLPAKFEEKGIILLEIDTKSQHTILSFEKLFQLIGNDLKEKDKKFKINRISFNGDGSRFFILLSFLSTNNTSIDLILSSDLNGEKINKIFGSGLHVNWKDNVNLCISGSIFTHDQVQLPSTVYETQDLTDEFSAIDKSFFSGDGQCSYSPDKRYILQDSDTSLEFPFRKLKIYDLEQKKGIILGYFFAHPNLYSNNLDLRCDLKARWSSCGTYITFDSIHEGYRGIYLINSLEAINEIERDIESVSEEEIKKIMSYEPVRIQESNFKIWKSESKEKIKNTLNKFLHPALIQLASKIYNYN